jgi:hypothetical protein
MDEEWGNKWGGEMNMPLNIMLLNIQKTTQVARLRLCENSKLLMMHSGSRTERWRS